MPHDTYTGVAMDTHIYQMFTDEVCSLYDAVLSQLIGIPFVIAGVARQPRPHPVCMRKRGTPD